MAVQKVPVITHVEIINRAILSIQNEIDDWSKKCEMLPKPLGDEMLKNATTILYEKLDTLKTMYYFETGTRYV